MKKAKILHKAMKAKIKSKSRFLDNMVTAHEAKEKFEKKANVYLEKIAKEKWIESAIKKPGALHKELGVQEDKKIPEAKLQAAAKKGGKLGERARLAETLKGMHKKANDMSDKKLKDKNAPGYGAVAKTIGKSGVRSAAEGLLGGTLGAGAGILASAAILARKYPHVLKAVNSGIGKGKLNSIARDKAALHTGISGAIGAVTGYTVGGMHGSMASMKNSLNKEYEKGKGQVKKANEMENKYLNKVANFLTDGAKAVFGAVKSDAAKLPDQLRNVGSAYKANGGLLNKGTMSTVKALGQNKALQAGAATVGAGVLAGKALSSGQQKEASENKYLAKLIK